MNSASYLFGRKDSRTAALCVATSLALFFFAFLPPGIYSLDGNSMLAVSESIVSTHSVDVPPGLGSPGRGGHFYSNWYPLLSLVALPLVMAARVLGMALHLPFHYLAAALACSIQVPLTAVTAGLVVLISTQLGATVSAAWLAGIVYGVGTIAMVYVRTFFAEPLLAFLVALGLYLAFQTSTRSIFVCGLVTALAVLAKPPGIFLGPVLSVYLYSKHIPVKKAVTPALGSICGLLVYAVYNQVRFGNPLQFGQPWSFLASVFPSAILGLLFSPGWGLIWYCPPLVLAVFALRSLFRSKLNEVCCILAVFGAFLLFHSLYMNWWAGWAWGPRYLVPGIPGLCALLAFLNPGARRVLILLCAAGFLINAPTLFSFHERHLAELYERGISTEGDSAWSIMDSALLQGWPAAIHQVRDASETDVRESFAQRSSPAGQIKDSRALRIIAVWWWVLPIAHIPRWCGLAISVIFVAVSLLILVRSAPGTATSKVDSSVHSCS